LKVVASKVASHINAFPDKVKAGVGFGHHGLTIQRFGINAAKHHLCFFPA
jgi:hypothetical protein